MADIIILCVGILAALRGADWLGRAGVSWAKRYHVPQIIIGATVVSLATTLPELSVATFSSFVSHEPQIALGAVLGSPLVNIGLILGLFFLFTSQRPQIGLYSRFANIFVIFSFLLLIVATNSSFGGMISFLLLSLGLAFLTLEILIARRSHNLATSVQSHFEDFFSLFNFAKERQTILEFLFGALFLVVGSKFIVDSVYSIAVSAGVNKLFLSLTVVALGTSLPELITAFNSLINKREDLALGNLVGASVIDLTIGVGLATISQPFTLDYPNNLVLFLPMLAIGTISLLVLWKKFPLKAAGILLIGTYLVFLISHFALGVWKQ